MSFLRVLLPALAITTAASAPTANADVIKCTFGNEYYRTIFDTSRQRLTLEDHSRGEDRVALSYVEGAKFQILGPGLFEIWSEDRQPVLRLRLTNQGRDGISEAYYPFEGELLNFGRPITGGCSSTYLRASKQRPSRPAPSPTPKPAPTPSPAPSPTPQPVPEPNPVPAPEPTPAPTPKPRPQPVPAPKPTPATVDPNAPKPGRVTPIET
jgi:hypothetical protein